MSENIQITNRLRNIIILSLSSVFIFVCFFSLIKTRSLINKPFPGFLVLENNVVCVLWLPEWEGLKQGIKTRDIVLVANGRSVKNADELNEIVAGVKPGSQIVYTILRGNRKIEIGVPVSLFTFEYYLKLAAVWILVALVVFSMGVTVFYMKPNSAASLAFLFLGCVIGLINASAWEFCSTHINHLPLYLTPMIGPSVVLVGLYFPETNKARKYFIAFLLITTIPLILLYRITFLNTQIYMYVDTAFLIHLAITLTMGVVLMCYSFFTSVNPITRQKGKVVVYGFTLAFLGAAFVLFGVLVLKQVNFYWLIAPVSLVPFTMGYAIVKHNVFDVDVLIRRSASYLLVSAIVLIFFFCVIGVLSYLLQNVTGQSSQIAAVIATIAVFSLFRPLQARVERYIGQKYFSEKYEYRQTIQKASKILVNIIDLHQLLYQMLDAILDAMKIERGIIILKEDNPEKYMLAAVEDFSAGFSPIEEVDTKGFLELNISDLNHPIYEYLEITREPIQINDIEELPELRQNRDAALGFMRDLGIVLIVPIVYEWRLTGILGLGGKRSGGWYSREDIELLQTLMRQTAVSIENARKVVELKKMVELETSYRELQRINELKDNFISMVSHDLRTPMTCIKGYAMILQESPHRFSNETVSEYLNIIIEESDRLTRLINNILDIQKFEAGKATFDFQDVEINKLVGETLNLFKPAAEKKSLVLEKEIPPREVIVSGDSDRLRQVLTNLLSNAVKFTPEGGRIKTVVEEVDYNGNSAVKVSVSDTGPGIPKHTQGELFQKFQQLSSPVRKQDEGSGLGLALVREIIEHHGGQVGVESEAGQGSTFYFLLQTRN